MQADLLMGAFLSLPQFFLGPRYGSLQEAWNTISQVLWTIFQSSWNTVLKHFYLISDTFRHTHTHTHTQYCDCHSPIDKPQPTPIPTDPLLPTLLSGFLFRFCVSCYSSCVHSVTSHAVSLRVKTQGAFSSLASDSLPSQQIPS